MTDSSPSVGEEPFDGIAPNFDVMRSIYGVGNGPEPEPSAEDRHDGAFSTMRSIFGVENDEAPPPSDPHEEAG